MQLDSIHVLVVDDVKTTRILAEDLLMQVGFKKIDTAASVQDAQEIMESHSVHMVLSDWHMSPNTGLELLKWVRVHEKYKNLPFIFFTAEKTKECVMQAIENKVDGYLLKPLTPEQVEEKVFQVLSKKGVLT